MAKIDMMLNREVEAAIAKLRQIPKLYDDPKVREEILKPAAEIVQKAARGNVRNAERPVKRYSTAKFSKNIRAPKGRGNVIATYLPGNLKLSIKLLKFKRSKAIFVGAKAMKRNPKGTFGKGKRADGWYAHFVEFGTRHSHARPFMRPAAMSSAKAVGLRMKYGIDLALKKWMIKNTVR